MPSPTTQQCPFLTLTSLIIREALNPHLLVPSFLISLSFLIISNSPADHLTEILDYSEVLWMMFRILWGMLHYPVRDLPEPIRLDSGKTLYPVPIAESWRFGPW